MNLFRRSNGMYYIKFTDADGIERRISTGQNKKNDALKYLTYYKSEINKPKLIHRTFGSIKQKYLDYSMQKFSKGYYALIKSTFKRIEPIVSTTLLKKIAKPELEKFIHDRIIISIHGAYIDYRNLRSFFNWCISNNYLDENPISKIQFPAIPEKNNIFISSEQFEEILKNEPTQILKDIYQFGFLTGMRLGEILNCRLSWISLREKSITVQSNETFRTKNRKSRTIPMNDKLFEIVRNYIPRIFNLFEDRYLFTKRGIKLNESFVSHKFKNAVRLSFGNDCELHFHNLRGSFGSELIRKNVSTYYVMKLLGHSSLSVTEKNYLSLKIDDLRKAVNLLGEK